MNCIEIEVDSIQDTHTEVSQCGRLSESLLRVESGHSYSYYIIHR
jgi:hypothetical protein